MRHRLVVLGVYVTTCLLFLGCSAINPACECVVFQSYGLNSGRFTSPNFPQPYPSSTNCILYTFIGDANELIRLTFVEFNLKMRNDSGYCYDFLKVYQNLDRPEVNEYSRADLEFCGGYSSIQNTVFSSGRSLVLEFHSDFRMGKKGNYTGFNGIFQFLDERDYRTTGIRVQGKQCTYDFKSNQTHKEGQFFSPFYPQEYKPLSSCSYRFHAKRGERVNVRFTNIQLHHIDASCRDSPDAIEVYDGLDDSAPMIGQFCGMRNGEELTSTGSSLLVTFACDERDQSQGFAAKYKFVSSRSNKAPKSVNNQSADSAGVPILDKNVDCNEKIDSRTHRNGTIQSPYHPLAYPADLHCRYTFTGVGRERIQLRFLHIDLHHPNGQASKPLTCEGFDSVSVKIIINGKTADIDTWCGRELPPMLMSSQPNMIVEFRSYHSSVNITGFKAQYSFVNNFGITGGEQDNRGTCVFNYRSMQRPSGEIWSPNYDGYYPRNTECHYLFYGRSNEQVHIKFIKFDVDGINPRCESSTNSDYVSFSNFAETEDRKMTRLCGQPDEEKLTIWSDGPFFRVIFKSNDIFDSTGFFARYEFKDADDARKGRSSSGRLPDYSRTGNGRYDHHPGDVLPSNHGHSKTAGDAGCNLCPMTSSWLLCLLVLLFSSFFTRINRLFGTLHSTTGICSVC